MLCLFCACSINAQDLLGEGMLRNLRTSYIATNLDTIALDTLSIVPHSESFGLPAGSRIPPDAYRIEYAEGLFVWLQAPQNIDSVLLSYRVFPYGLTRTHSHKNRDMVQKFGEQPYGYYQYQVQQKTAADDLFNMQGLDYNGSFARGISFGSNQDLVVNSDFNLQMAGKLPNGIEVLAAITDSNIPFEPEGNTQQIQEFDAIYIQLKKNRHVLLAGDYEIRKPQGYFMNFNRKVQGARFTTGFKAGKRGDLTAGAAAAISRGNFHRMIFNGQEGNQGPYKMFGANGEAFIIVLANTERVYIDGKLLTRGAGNDYIIDYNSAEIRFTDRQLITKDKRITLEFEYSDRNYLRSMFYVNATYKTEKLTLYTGLFSEQDAKNQTLTDGDFDTEADLLAGVGDSIQNALLQNFAPVERNSLPVLYHLKDTVSNGVSYQIYEYDDGSDTLLAVYAPAFRFAGAGQGDYRILQTNVNGRIYEWTAADSLGNQTGSYQIGALVVAPQKRQLFIVGADYALGKNDRLKAEFSLSNKDVNTFSDLGDGDDKGVGLSVEYEGKRKLKPDGVLDLSNSIRYEFVGKTFNAIEPYRPVEFIRDWNLAANTQIANEHLFAANLRLQNKNIMEVAYAFGFFMRDNNLYKGYRHGVNAKYRKNGWLAQLSGSYLTSRNSETGKTAFLRPKAELSRSFKKLKGLKIGIRAEAEHNRILDVFEISGEQRDSLNRQSFFYHQTEAYFSTPDTSSLQINGGYIRRWDYAPDGKAFAGASKGQTINFGGEWRTKSNNQLLWNLTYRDLKVENEQLTQEGETQTYLGNINYIFSLKKGGVRSNTQYQIGTGQKQIVQYQYIVNQLNEGAYIYLGDDAETDKDLSLFVPQSGAASIGETTYDRFVLPTNEYRRTNIVQFTQSLHLNPKAVWYDVKGIKKFVSRFSTQSTFSVRRESLADTTLLTLEGVEITSDYRHFLPIGLKEEREALVVSENTNMRNALHFNRNSPDFEADIYDRKTINKTLLVNGTDKRLRHEHGMNVKYIFNKWFSLQGNANFGKTVNDSRAFPERNYLINFWAAEPTAVFTAGNKFRLNTSYRYKQSQDVYESPDNQVIERSHVPAIQRSLTADARYGSFSKSLVSLKMSFVSVSYDNTLTQFDGATVYQLLEGLQPGGNYLWGLSLDTKLSGNIRLNLSYDGRKNGDNQPHHVGRASVRALF